MSVDKRGWILASASGVACALGACIICIDKLTKHIPRWRHFSIRENSTFLAASLSLSFGVMIFSSLYNVLPESKEYFMKAGHSPEVAGYRLMGGFLGGIIGLVLVSEVLHRCLPSSIVECESHSHSPNREDAHIHHHDTEDNHNHSDDDGHEHGHERQLRVEDEETPLLDRHVHPRLKTIMTRSLSNLVKKCQDGKCYGYTDNRPCGVQCRNHLIEEEANKVVEDIANMGVTCEDTACTQVVSGTSTRASSVFSHTHGDHAYHSKKTVGHHHVAKNEYLSIGLQTVIAVALHKIPEGFITFATNHASPKLGLTIFMALFVHNISEGFVMSLPLFLAFKSRWKAIATASFLGGLSQPLGALAASIWLGNNDGDRKNQDHFEVYGWLFSITAGIMCSVGLQLYAQAVNIHHSSRLCLLFGTLGMGILGLCYAMTGGDA
ncbi:Zinc/iron permease [Ascobolus immersus RN42]|uniref:Zinc/iron permease n=1 Tax=Ascobolus immersus RN42 TaxID=1160509 RepID=A0A3N4IPH4_ASCIM|nr:Zinc/iron permease [Ascobolus immersus RN42]